MQRLRILIQVAYLLDDIQYFLIELAVVGRTSDDFLSEDRNAAQRAIAANEDELVATMVREASDGRGKINLAGASFREFFGRRT